MKCKQWAWCIFTQKLCTVSYHHVCYLINISRVVNDVSLFTKRRLPADLNELPRHYVIASRIILITLMAALCVLLPKNLDSDLNLRNRIAKTEELLNMCSIFKPGEVNILSDGMKIKVALLFRHCAPIRRNYRVSRQLIFLLTFNVDLEDFRSILF